MASARNLEDIKSRVRLADLARQYLTLRPMGGRWVAPCPFHQETKPSFSISEDGHFYCFGCQAKGDLFDFYARMNGVEFPEAVEALAEMAGVRLDRDSRPGDAAARNEAVSERRQILRMHEIAQALFTANLEGDAGAECRAYMKGRGIDPEAARAFGLGWSLREWQPLTEAIGRAGLSRDLGVAASLLSRSAGGRVFDRFRGRLMFPIRNMEGRTIAFGGRIIADEDEAKYVNSSDTPVYRKGDHLFGMGMARRAVSAGVPAMLTEGYMDVLTLHQFGYAGAMGVLGTALTPNQIRRLSCLTSRVELLFDGDPPGRKAALRSAGLLLPRGLACKVVLFPDDEDIDGLLKGYGREAFEKLRHEADEGLDFCIKTLQDMPPRDAIGWVHEFLKAVDQPELVSRFVSAFARGLDLSEPALRERVADDRGTREPMPRRATVPVAAGGHTHDREIMTFLVRYPRTLASLREAGAHLCLRTDAARDLWRKIERNPSETVACDLSEREKDFWMRCRVGDAPPLTNEQGELAAVLSLLRQMQRAERRRLLTRGMFDSDEDFLKALQASMENGNGK